MTTTLPPGTLLADDAAAASVPLGPCAVCQHPVTRGQRYARLIRSRRPAHAWCIAAITGLPERQQRRTAP